MTDDPERDIARALAARRPAPSSDLERRLRARADAPRPMWLVPSVLAGLVAAAAAVVLVLRVPARDPDPTGPTLAELATPPPVPTPPKLAAPADLPAGPGVPERPIPKKLERSDDLLAPYQDLLDGVADDTRLDDGQRSRLRDVADALAKQHALLAAQHEVAMIELRRELDRPDIDATKATAIFDRVAAAEAALRKAELSARIAARAVLTPQQRVASARPKPKPPAKKPSDASGDLGGNPFAKATPRPIDPFARRGEAKPGVLNPFDTTHPPSGTLIIASQPPGAEVRVDGVAVGNTPVRQNFAPGNHVVEVAKQGYRVVRIATQVTANDTQTVNAALDKDRPATGKLEVRSGSQSRVLLDGNLIGTTPLVIEVAPGRHDVHVERNGIKLRRVVTIKTGRTEIVSMDPPF